MPESQSVINPPIFTLLSFVDGAARVHLPPADGDRVGQLPGSHHPALAQDPQVKDELLHHAPGPGRPQRGAALRVHRHRVEGDHDLGGGAAGLQAHQVSPGGCHLRLDLRPGGAQHRQIRRHHPPHGLHWQL